MPKFRSWTDEQLIEAVKSSKSIRSVIIQLGLVPAGGNYAQIKSNIKKLNINTDHFTGQGWYEGWKSEPAKRKRILQLVLTPNSDVQSYGLKKRLFKAGLKTPKCEICGWCQMSPDGRIPVELDHINGDHRDNRLENLRVLCPNCHSLQPTHRGRNKKVVLTNNARVL